MPTYISAEGLTKLNEELNMRKKQLRGEISERISAAKELGDLSENFEYHEAKEQQGLNEMRILQLEHMLKDVVMVEQQSGGEHISLGTHFTVSANGKKQTFEMVGSNESNPLSGKISNESPLGRAFMGHKVGEDVEVRVPSGVIVYRIITIT